MKYIAYTTISTWHPGAVTCTCTKIDSLVFVNVASLLSYSELAAAHEVKKTYL